MLRPSDTVVLGVSGGSDSIGLLHLLLNLKEYRLKLIVAHINHRLRGKESERDANFVRKKAQGLGLTFEYREVNTLKFKEKNKLSLEDAARRLRYEFLQEVFDKHSANVISTAHTLNDQAETVLMRLVRGSGTLGLSAISPVSGKLVRPAMNISSKEIQEYLTKGEISWMEDSSNKSTDFFRNKIRLELIPLLEAFNPNIISVLARSSDILRIESSYLESEVEKIYEKIISKNSLGLIGKVRGYLNLPKALKFGVIRKAILKIKGDLNAISSEHIISIDEILRSNRASSEVALSGGVYFAKGHKFFCIANNRNISSRFSYEIKDLGKTKLAAGFFVEVESSTDKSYWGDENIGHFSPRKTELPLRIRSFKSGDRFIPLGMKKFKKVKDFFIDEKIPRFLRKRVPIIESNDGKIIWICGLRVDDRFRVARNEKKFLRIRVKSPELSLLNYFRDS